MHNSMMRSSILLVSLSLSPVAFAQFQPFGLDSISVTDLRFYGGVLYASTDGKGVFRRALSDTGWESIGLEGKLIRSVYPHQVGPVGFAVTVGIRPDRPLGDSILVYWEGNPTTRTDDQWLPAQLQKAPDPGFCNDSVVANHPAYLLTLQPQWINNATLNQPFAIPNGAPVRGYDKVVYRVYQSTDGNWYLGQRSPAQGGTMQPLIGPLIGANGVTFTYFDTAGAQTNVVTQVAEIEIVLRARTASPIRRGGTGVQAYKVDSVVTRVALRNNPRCGSGTVAPIVVYRPCQ